MSNRSIVRQFGLIFVITFAGIFVLLQTDLLSHMAYTVEKGRLRALREAMPSAEEVARASLPAREVAQLTLPAVVSITSEGQSSASMVERLLEGWDGPEDGEGRDEARRWLEEHVGPQIGVGSGFVIDAEEGLVLTNYHVIEGAQTIRVMLSDGREEQARVVGTDPDTDLALIGIDADRLHELPLADSGQVGVGDDVFALGNPFGLAGSVSRGIISGRGRSRVSVQGAVYQGFLQTDAVINPGNSGGPLVNLRGEVVGVNTAIATLTGRYDGVGFAIPASRVAEVLPALVRGEKVKRGFLGVLPVAVAEAPELAAELGWEESSGIIVARVVPNSAAAEAGLRADDVILEIDGVQQKEIPPFMETLARTAPGSAMSLKIWRGGRTMALQVTLSERPQR
ncbi:MAG TPA: trypsin-like peptidase domain-containing protein [Phycisphaerae bacterium]|nr:trypsin-like peptidase domain-containing protein [Phycisphaerae bacterium]